MTDITELKRLADEAEDTLQKAQRTKDDEFRARVKEFEQQLRVDMDQKHNANIAVHKQAYAAAVVARDAVIDAAAREGAGAPFPLGTRFVEWEYRRWPEGYSRGEVGVLEAVTKDTIHPDNISRWRIAELGSFIIRRLKKDGTASKKYERWGTEWVDNPADPDGARFSVPGKKPPYGWHIEGFDPNSTIKPKEKSK